MPALSLEIQLLLVFIALLSGIGITAIGPGGIFVTIALYSLTTILPSEVAGTASATFIATGLIGSAIYVRSGELKHRASWSIALRLSITSVIGALLGAELNTYLSERLFGLLLGIVVMAIGALIIYQEWRGLEPRFTLDVQTRGGRTAFLVLGLVLGVAGAMLGVGGPVLAVPVLVVLGVPMLVAVAVAQVQSVFIAAFATVGYALNDAVLVPLAILVGVPELIGVFIGWIVAHRIDPARLKLALGVLLLLLGPYLAR